LATEGHHGAGGGGALGAASVPCQGPVEVRLDGGTDGPAQGFDVQNDHEFGSEAERVALEFGFITVKDGAVTKGAHAVRNTKAWVEHVKEVVAAVEGAYPDICPAAPKVYRLAILTHGSANAGLKFVDPEAPETGLWFTKRDLEEDEGRELIDGLAACLAPAPVVAIYACSTGGNESLKQRERELLDSLKARLVQENAASLKQKLAEIPADAPTRKALEKKVRSEHGDLLAKAIKEAKEDVKKAWPKPGYEQQLVSYGGDPDSTAPFKNTMGEESFAREFRNQLATRQIAADVWAHTDAGHTSRNARMRLFRSDGTTSDLVRLVFGDSAEFKPNKQPSEKQLSWWWNRGNEKIAPVVHQQAVKKAALCSAASLDDDQLAFSLKSLIADFRNWYSA
jgi:hypothetical protein